MHVSVPNDLVKTVDDLRAKERPIPTFSDMLVRLARKGVLAYEIKTSQIQIIRFCDACGRPLEPEGARFCDSCGRPLFIQPL